MIIDNSPITILNEYGLDDNSYEYVSRTCDNMKFKNIKNGKIIDLRY